MFVANKTKRKHLFKMQSKKLNYNTMIFLIKISKSHANKEQVKK